MLKKLCLFKIAAMTTIAVAHHILVIGSNGRGTANSQDGRLGSFHYSATKTTAEGHGPQFAGSLRFEQHQNHSGPRVLIEMGRPTVVNGVNGGVCEFSGPGSLTTQVKGHSQTVHGTVSANVVDRRNPHHNPHSPPDMFRIRFTNPNTTFIFEGLVHHGDLTVFSRQTH